MPKQCRNGDIEAKQYWICGKPDVLKLEAEMHMSVSILLAIAEAHL